MEFSLIWNILAGTNAFLVTGIGCISSEKQHYFRRLWRLNMSAEAPKEASFGRSLLACMHPKHLKIYARLEVHRSLEVNQFGSFSSKNAAGVQKGDNLQLL